MDSDLENKLDKIAEHVRSIDRYNSITLRNLSKSFLLGMVGAFGATAGLAILFTVIGFILHIFGALPVIGIWFNHLAAHVQK